MKRTTLVFGLWVASAGHVQAQGSLAWKRIDVVTRLDNDGVVQVAETHEITVAGNVSPISRDFNFAADQQAIVRGVFRLEPDGSKHPLKDAPTVNPDSYQVYTWGVLYSLKGESEPALESTTRRYLIEYTLKGAVTPGWDLAAGPLPLDVGTSPRNPLTRAGEVIIAWREAWPDLDRTYRFDHDVVFPTRGTPLDLPELNYRLEYGDAWVLLSQDRDIGVAIRGVDYRVQRGLRYLPAGRPPGVNLQPAAFRITAIVGPLLVGLLLCFLFVAVRRLAEPAPHGDRALFESRIGALPEELVASHFEVGAVAPSFEEFVTRMAAQKKMAVTEESPETEDSDAVVRLRLATSRQNLHAFERAIVDGLFGSSDSISSDELRQKFQGREFDPDELVGDAYERFKAQPVGGAKPRRAREARRPLWAVTQLGLLAAGLALLVKNLLDHPMGDPLPIFAGLVPGGVIASLWPKGSSTRPISLGTLLGAVVVLGLIGMALALSPNTPLSGLASVGLCLMGIGHCAGYVSRIPKSSPIDLEMGAAKAWAIRELRRPRPALSDGWVGSLQASGAGRSLAQWKKRYGNGGMSTPDFTDTGRSDAPTGPAFTGEAPRTPALPANFADSFRTYEDEDASGDAKQD